MKFHFILQPLMAAIAAILDGLKDARTGRSPYFWTMLDDPHGRVGRIEGIERDCQDHPSRPGNGHDPQIIVLKRFYPAEAVIVALLLAFVPYLIIRSPGAPDRTPVARGTFAASLVTAPISTVVSKGIEHGRSTHRREVRSKGDGGHLAGWIRTRLSVERTMMSWQRTAVALIGFGFAIVQYFNRLQEIPAARRVSPAAPEYLGLALISCGILALVISIWQYRWTVRYLWGGSFAPIAGMRADVTKEKMQSPVIAVAILTISIGLFAFFAVLLRLT